MSLWIFLFLRLDRQVHQQTFKAQAFQLHFLVSNNWLEYKWSPTTNLLTKMSTMVCCKNCTVSIILKNSKTTTSPNWMCCWCENSLNLWLTVPVTGLLTQAIAWRMVDFPIPFGPKIATCGFSVKSISKSISPLRFSIFIFFIIVVI